tara:strand:+ start:369 stop:671 length:303 start_codon:yes stop_codon:yes gene_type:complete
VKRQEYKNHKIEYHWKKLEYFYEMELQKYAYLILGMEETYTNDDFFKNPKEVRQWAEDNWRSLMDILCENFLDCLESIDGQDWTGRIVTSDKEEALPPVE